MLGKTYQNLKDATGENKTLRLSFAVGSFFFLLGTLLLLLKFQSLPPQIPLFYSKPWGEERIPEKIWLWLIPFISFLIISFNFLIIPVFIKKERFLVIILSLTSTVSLFLLFWTLIQILILIS
ncbi:hypothetical protein A2Z23_00140 [Candidatus Curtissbacteria bacterium RBG_16_39_7]|uniref:DUF1648 domain-containing protein n=1 Tax=Candidatus Curtissbacteria bacterium RBG_16_39_7 TaxID=1797707 RepID=A0A1F5G3C1_9BACT|nr:MAG: hypothetical protein A2Z23_00140 [Candidatus Curtissbacteria bacterium RBG_16_39_7]